jgi:hypothetical protein
MWRQLFCKDIIIYKLYGLTAKNICKVIYQSVKFINIYLAILINFQHINICSYCQIIQCIITRICHGFVVRCWMAPFLWCIACSHLQNVFELGAYHNLLCYQDVINIFIYFQLFQIIGPSWISKHCKHLVLHAFISKETIASVYIFFQECKTFHSVLSVYGHVISTRPYTTVTTTFRNTGG